MYFRGLGEVNHIPQIGESALDGMQLHVVLTVPAIWKDYARESMARAAYAAGIVENRPAGQTTLSFAPEPEAAALSTLSESDHRVKKRNVYVICDAGGGTIDLISYKIDSTHPTVLSEAVAGTGSLCGGVVIDDAFKSMCKERLGYRWDRLSPEDIDEIMKDEWEPLVKTQFKDGIPAKKWVVKIPRKAFRNESADDKTREPHIKNGYIWFSS